MSRTLAEMLGDELGLTTEYPVTMRLGPDGEIVVKQHYPETATHLDGSSDA
ncbi:MAG: hypothetical protein LC798_19690 [Chloroflexi bacterium]|nr:hypothetical protein [Chloroflexota bacterium]